MSIAIGLPMTEMVYGRFVQYLLSLEGWSGTQVITVVGAYLQSAHNKIVAEFLGGKADQLLMLEQDMIYPQHLLSHVAALPPKAVIGCLYFNRHGDPTPVAFKWADEDRLSIRPLTASELIPMLQKPDLYPVDVVGMGCTVIARHVLEEWPQGERPYFAVPTYDIGSTMSDDVYFCRRVQDRGYQIYLDTRVIPKHMTFTLRDEEDFSAWVYRTSIAMANAEADLPLSPLPLPQ